MCLWGKPYHSNYCCSLSVRLFITCLFHHMVWNVGAGQKLYRVNGHQCFSLYILIFEVIFSSSPLYVHVYNLTLFASTCWSCTVTTSAHFSSPSSPFCLHSVVLFGCRVFDHRFLFCIWWNYLLAGPTLSLFDVACFNYCISSVCFFVHAV